jgi:integrase/recombinase XerD
MNVKTAAVMAVRDRAFESGSMRALIPLFLEWLRVRGYAGNTVSSREFYVLCFVSWCEERGVTHPGEVTKQVIERYQRWLYHHRTAQGRALGFSSQHTRLTAVRMYFKWLSRENLVLYNPAADMVLPRRGRHLPKHVLSADEVETIMNLPDVTTGIGLRDRAILETLYSTGVRRTELVNLKLYNLDSGRGVLSIRQGKGHRDRVVPIGRRALAWIDQYLTTVRPTLVVEPDEMTLFLCMSGKDLRPQLLGSTVKEYFERAGLQGVGSCHLFRHTMATLMLENGADVRYVQAMLGHASIETTQMYTHVAIRQLKEIHEATHPAKLPDSLLAPEAVTRLKSHYKPRSE